MEVNYTYSWPIKIVERIFTEIPENNPKNNSNNNVISSSKKVNSQPSPQPVQEINNTTTAEATPTIKEKSQEILELELEQHALEMQAAMRRRLQKQQQPSHPITPPYKEKPVIEKVTTLREISLNLEEGGKIEPRTGSCKNVAI